MYNTYLVIYMDSLILRTYETFDEIPEANLLVNQNSNLMYVRIGRNVFIAREFIDKIIFDNSSVIYTINYLNVKQKEIVLTLEIKKDIHNGNNIITNKRADMEIIPLNEILQINGTSTLLLNLEDVDNLINFNGEFEMGKKNSLI